MKRTIITAAICVLAFAGTAQARGFSRPYASSSYLSGGSYTNSNGHQVHRPVSAYARPAGASARCGDGSYSFSEHHRGTCSHHGGVGTWF